MFDINLHNEEYDNINNFFNVINIYNKIWNKIWSKEWRRII